MYRMTNVKNCKLYGHPVRDDLDDHSKNKSRQLRSVYIWFGRMNDYIVSL